MSYCVKKRKLKTVQQKRLIIHLPEENTTKILTFWVWMSIRQTLKTCSGEQSKSSFPGPGKSVIISIAHFFPQSLLIKWDTVYVHFSKEKRNLRVTGKEHSLVSKLKWREPKKTPQVGTRSQPCLPWPPLATTLAPPPPVIAHVITTLWKNIIDSRKLSGRTFAIVLSISISPFC